MTGAEVLLNLVIGMTGSLIAAVIYEYARARYQFFKRQRRLNLLRKAELSKGMFRGFLKKVVSSGPTAILKKSAKGGLDHFTEPEQLPPFRYSIGPVGTREQVVEYLSRTVPRPLTRSTLAHEIGHTLFKKNT